MEVIISEFRFKRVHSEVPDGCYKHQFPEVIKEERKRTCNFNRGNRVNVTDGSYNFDAKTGLTRAGIDTLFKTQSAVIIETGCERFVEGVLDWHIQVDLLLLFEDGTEVYCASNCVQLLTRYKELFDYEKAAACYNKGFDHSDFHTL